MPTDLSTRGRLVARIQERLFSDLGNECALADSHGHECSGPLEVDHPWGRDWVPREHCWYNRWLRYAREHEEGRIRLLCRYHNERVRPRRLEEAGGPF